MGRHRWQAEKEYEYGTKPHRCIKCGLTKEWAGGDYQSWQYTTYSHGFAMNGDMIVSTHTTWKRPECTSKAN